MIFWPDAINLGYSSTDFTFFQNWLFEGIGLLASITEYLLHQIASLAAIVYNNICLLHISHKPLL